jgi:hypothetical protein
VNLTIKNIPEDVYKSLKEEAARQKRSLNAQAIVTIAANLEPAERKKRQRRRWNELERFVASLPPMSDSVPLSRADRRSH